MTGSRRLQLGPLIGHTDHASSTIWIRVFDNPALYTLRVTGVGDAPFISTENNLEFGTAIGKINGLRPDRKYRYRILRKGRTVPNGSGTFRTMPDSGLLAEFQFVVVSCNGVKEIGAWHELKEFIDRTKPRFLIMMGDQVYLDNAGNVWKDYAGKSSEKRRMAMADKYQANWSRHPIPKIMANIPTYMVWDDHEIRDGWGSFAADSPVLADKYPRGAKIFDRHNNFFNDARDVYWHFQMAHNPPLPLPVGGNRFAMPFVFQCGGLLVLVTDSRGNRDLWRPESPILGEDQWQFITDLLENIPSSVEAIAIVTPAPIASMSPENIGQKTIGKLEPDVRKFRRGDAKGIEQLIDTGGTQINLGKLDKLESLLNNGKEKFRGNIDDIRDQWAHHISRPEQEKLIRLVAKAGTVNRINGSPRAVIFLSGDIHIGGIFDISVSNPSFKIPCLVSSGISQTTDTKAAIGVVVDENFQIAPGIKSKLRDVVQSYNFGVVQFIPGSGTTPQLIPAVVGKDGSNAGFIRVGKNATF